MRNNLLKKDFFKDLIENKVDEEGNNFFMLAIKNGIEQLNPFYSFFIEKLTFCKVFLIS
jgi:hypothetical protein